MNGLQEKRPGNTCSFQSLTSKTSFLFQLFTPYLDQRGVVQIGSLCTEKTSDVLQETPAWLGVCENDWRLELEPETTELSAFFSMKRDHVKKKGSFSKNFLMVVGIFLDYHATHLVENFWPPSCPSRPGRQLKLSSLSLLTARFSAKGLENMMIEMGDWITFGHLLSKLHTVINTAEVLILWSNNDKVWWERNSFREKGIGGPYLHLQTTSTHLPADPKRPLKHVCFTKGQCSKCKKFIQPIRPANASTWRKFRYWTWI